MSIKGVKAFRVISQKTYETDHSLRICDSNSRSFISFYTNNFGDEDLLQIGHFAIARSHDNDKMSYGAALALP